MADGNDEDLVSQVKVEGTEQAAADIEAYADKAAAGFDKIADAAAKSSSRTGASITQMAADAAKARKAAADLQTFKPSPDQARALREIESSARSFASSLKPLTLSIARFGQRVAILATAATAAGGALLRAASNVAKSATGTSDSLKKQTDAQVESNDAMLDAKVASIQFDATQQALFRSWQSGKITYEEYTAQIKENTKQFDEAQRVARDVAFVTKQVKEENERLQATLKKREEYNKLIDTFGGPLTSALVTFGRQIEATRQQMLAAFGPGIAAAVDAIGGALSKNASGIAKFFDEAGKKIDAFVANNGPAIQTALANIGAAAGAVFTGVIDALPSLIAFFNDGVVPAVKGVLAVFQSLADGINAVFGTKVTAGFLVMIALIGTMSGALKLLFNVVKTVALGFNTLRLAAAGVGIGFAPFLLIVVAVAAALYLLYTQVDWPAFAERAKSAIATIITFFTNLKNGAIAVKDAIVQKWTDLITFFTELPGKIATFFTEMWEGAKTTAADAVAWVIAKWDELVAWFAALPGRIGQFFVDLWNAVKQTFSDAMDAIKSKVKEWVDSLKAYLKPILDLINAIAGGANGGGGGGGGNNTVTAKTGGHVRGAGTGTSDSIPAWLSNNEYVVKAKAVGKYGVGFMDAINSGRLRLPRLNVGGFTGMRQPGRTHFKDGGLATAGGGKALNLSLFGEDFEGLMMPDNVADRMTKFAIGRQTRSAGRKPSWVGGNR